MSAPPNEEVHRAPQHPLAGLIHVTATATVVRADGTTDEEN